MYSFSKAWAEGIVHRARNYNLEGVLDAFLMADHPGNVRRHLQDIYFYLVQATVQEGCIDRYIDQLYSLQTLIEGIDAMTDTKEKYLEVRMI